VLKTKDRKAQKLFPSSGPHDDLPDAERIIFESAEVLVKSGRIADAVRTLIATGMSEARTRRAIRYLLDGLWRYQPPNVGHPTTDPGVVSELLALADTLNYWMYIGEPPKVHSYSPQYGANARETQFAVFKARHNNDFEALRGLRRRQVAVEDYATALLCFHCGGEFGRKLTGVFDRRSGRLPHATSYPACRVSPNPLDYQRISVDSVPLNNCKVKTYTGCHFERPTFKE